MDHQSQHYVQNRIIRNWKYNQSKNNHRVHYYSLVNKSISDVRTKELFEEDLFYDQIKVGLENRLNEEIEDPFIKLIDSIDFSKKEIEITRKQLFVIKRYLALQFVRTKSYFENQLKFDKEKMAKMIEDILNVSLNDTPKEDSLFHFMFHDNYLAFWKTPRNIEFVLADKGIIKEPSSLYSYWIFPITPSLSIALLPVEFKKILNNPNFPFTTQGRPTIALDICALGYFNVIKDPEVIELMCRSVVPLVYYIPNKVEYQSTTGKYCQEDIFKYKIFSLDILTASYLSFTIMDEATTGFAFHDISKIAFPIFSYSKCKREAPLLDFSVLYERARVESPNVIQKRETIEKIAEEFEKLTRKKFEEEMAVK